MAMRVLRGASGGSGLGVVVGEADVPSGVIYRVSGPAGPAGRPGVDAGGALTGAGLAALVSGAPVKGLPVDADVLPLLDSAASGGLARLSLAGLRAALSSAFVTLSGRQTVADKTFVAPRVSGSATVPASIVVDGSDANIGLDLRGKGTGQLTYMGAAVVTDAVVHGSPVKSAPVDADELALLDSAESCKVTRFSWASLTAAILAWFGPVKATLSNKNLSAASNVFPTSLVTLTGAQSLSNKTLVTPTITGPTINPVTAAPNALALTAGRAHLRANSNNVAFGRDAQRSVTTGNNNVAVGLSAQYSLTTGGDNVAVGLSAQYALTEGRYNVALGFAAQSTLTTGSSNIALGRNAQQSLTTGNNNVAVGYNAQYSPLGLDTPTTTASNQTSVGYQSGQNTATQIDGITTIGYLATAGAVNGTSLGISSRADHTDSVALGSNTHTTAANQVMVGPRDVEITHSTKGLVLQSPDGSRFRISVDNAGVLSAA